MKIRANYHPLCLAILAGLSAQTWADDLSQDSATTSAEQTSNATSSDVTSSGADDTITVYGRALSVYRAQQASLATKTATDIDDTPQSIQVLPQQLIEDQGARQVTDLYRSISGVSQYSYSGVTFRGFREDEILYDGVRGDPFNGFAIPQLFNIEQVEVLKGPSSAIGGSGEPGGVINYTTKKPTYDTERKVSVTGGNQDFVSGSVELSGPVNDDATQRYRVGIYQDHENPSRDNTDVRNRIIDLGYAWDITDATTVTTQFTDIIQHYGGARLRGIPTDEDGNFLTDIDWNANSSSDYQDLEARVYQIHVDHVFNDWLSGNVTARYYENKETQKYHEPVGFTDTDGDGVVDWSERQYRDQVRQNKAGSLTANLIADLGAHTLLFGADYYRVDQDYVYYRAKTADGVSGISLTDPDYSDDVSSYNLKLTKQTSSRSDRFGAYVQDQWDITDKWNVLSGLRVDTFDDQVNDIVNDTVSSYNGSGLSYRLGSTYKINQNLHPYAVVATGFVPQDAADQADANGGPFDPEESLMYETGLRSYWFDNALNINIAAYHIIKENILQTDPDDSDRLVAYGKVRSQGVEVDILADLTENWTANLSYAYNDTRVKKAYDGITNAVGTRFSNAPHNQLGAWTRYDINALNSSMGFGADYVSEQYNRSGSIVKSYVVYDASWQTHWQQWQFQLNVKNLFNKEYAVSGFTDNTGHFPGEKRRIYLTASYNF
ncbi:iron complex outermembrane recepter protein [Vibrio xiamenensis]|uniref:Iron complex outermembrane recepter protein n=1 Tax=Vibrio xiamenensis TaxID=861298 RepID=A0A1G8E015_9VIBR|nr:TonB-dependent receptor [Vibrio xiamenensis]SDH63234.1 iron complex outermembrane recepter protein [Vibrio xiamenensis]